MQATERRFATVTEGPLKNFRIHYQDFGTGEAVVMMHGSGPGASGWSNLSRNVGPLVEAGYRVVLVDSPGWSPSDPILVEKGPRAVHNAAAVKGVLDELGVDQAHIVGNSMGGVGCVPVRPGPPASRREAGRHGQRRCGTERFRPDAA